MKAVVSTLFRVMSFPHNGNIVTVDQLSFASLDSTTNNLTPLNVPYTEVVSTLPRVNYVATSPMFSVTDVSEPLTVFSTSFDLDPIIDMENSMGLFERNVLIHFESLDMCSFQIIVLPSDEDLLEAMIEMHPLTCVSSIWKPLPRILTRIVPFTVSTSLKNETCLRRGQFFSCVNLIKK